MLEELQEPKDTPPLEPDSGLIKKERRQDKPTAGHESQRISGEIHICLEDLNKALGEVSWYLRIKTREHAPIPENGLYLEHDGSLFTCQEANVQGWTFRLKVAGTQPLSLAPASSFDWEKDAVFKDGGNGWTARLKGRPVRVFVSGSNESLRGWVEEKTLSYNTEFLVACHQDYEAVIERWGQHCGLKKLNVAGLPDQWVLFEGKNATESCRGVDD